MHILIINEYVRLGRVDDLSFTQPDQPAVQ